MLTGGWTSGADTQLYHHLVTSDKPTSSKFDILDDSTAANVKLCGYPGLIGIGVNINVTRALKVQGFKANYNL